MEVMPLFAGYLPLPDVRLFKYLPHHSAHASQLDAGKEFTQGKPVLHKLGHILISHPMLKVPEVSSLTAIALASHLCRTVSTERGLNGQP